MARILKDERKVLNAQRIYDESVDNYLKIMNQLNAEIMDIWDIMDGYAKGKEDEKYNITAQQHSALKDQFNMWKANLREPDKILENIENELRKKHKRRQAEDGKKSKDDITRGNAPYDATPKVAVFKLRAD